MTRAWHRNRVISRQETSSTSYTDVVDLTFLPEPSTDYYLLWSVQLDVSATNNNAKHRLRDDTAGVNVANPIHRAPNTADVMSAGGVARWTSGASPPVQTFSVEHAVDVTATTLGSSDAYVMAISGADTDEYSESINTSTTTSSSLSDKTTLGFTPESPGDYLVLCSCEISGYIPASTHGVGRVLLDINGTQYFDTVDGYFAQTNGQYASWCHSVVVSLSSASQLFKISYSSSDNTTSTQIRNAKILAMRLDSFTAAYTSQESGRQSTTDSSPQVAAETSFDAQGREYIFIATALIDHSSSASTMEARLNWAGAARSAFKRRQIGPGDRRASYVALGYDALDAGTKVVGVEWWRTNSGTSSVTDAFVGAFLAVTDTELLVPSLSCGLSSPSPTVEVGSAAILPFEAVALSGRVPVVLTDVAVRPASASASLVEREPQALAHLVIRTVAATVVLVGHHPVRAGPLWPAVNENQAVWGDRVSSVTTWTPVSAA